VIHYRRFRNTDPPAVAAIWNDALTGRGAAPSRSTAPLERGVLSKPYFDPDGFIVATDEGNAVGFSHAGFGPNPEETALDTTNGVVCVVAVRESHRRRGVGTELLRRAEQYLRDRGARSLHAGPMRPLNPFYFGLYGGSDQPGFLCSDVAAAPFLEHHGYQALHSTLVFQRRLDQPLGVADLRFAGLRRRYELQVQPRTALGSWWQECVLGPLEPIEFRLEDKQTAVIAARALVWEMEGYSRRWNQPAAGVLEIQVRPELRRLGLAKFLLAQLLRYLQDQYFGVVEVQAPDRNQPAVALLQTLGFEQVDLGRVYRKEKG
jgi:ribosomal protein S18 acetylase RimI-like enzyme